MDKDELKKMYQQKVEELEDERNKLEEMFNSRVSLNAPLTDSEILRQNKHCGDVGLEVMKLKEMLEKED